MLSSKSWETITIQWEPLLQRERNGIVRMYKIICNIAGGSPATERTWEVGSTLTEYTITQLEADTLYKVAMAAKTMEYGPLSDWVSMRTRPVEETTGNQTSQSEYLFCCRPPLFSPIAHFYPSPGLLYCVCYLLMTT